MGKRFVDTSGYRQAWRKLDPKLRAAFYWLQENCDAAGYWTIDLDHFRFECGYALDVERLIRETKAVERHGSDALRMVDFVEVNYGVLKEGYNPHKPALRAIAHRQLSSLSQASTKLEDEDEEEDKSLEKERASVPADFAEFYAAYPVRKAKGAALRAWAKLTASERPLCKPAIEAQLKAKHFLGGDGKNYVPHPATWLNERRWEDEVGGSSVLNMSGNPVYGKAEAEAEMKAIRIANGRDPVMGSVFDNECSRDLLVYRGVIKERA